MSAECVVTLEQIEALVRFGQAARSAGLSLQRLIPGMDAFREAILEAEKALRDAYEKAGSPYGKTQKGLERWLREQSNEYHACLHR